MKEEFDLVDCTVEVNGFFYKVPYFVLLVEEAISTYLLYYTGFMPDAPNLSNLLREGDNHHKTVLQSLIKGLIAQNPKEYYSYRYVKLNDVNDDREAMQRYVNQFAPESTLDALKRELAFFAACEYMKTKYVREAAL